MGMNIVNKTPPYIIKHYINPKVTDYTIKMFNNAGYDDFDISELNPDSEDVYNQMINDYNTDNPNDHIIKEYIVLNSHTHKPVSNKHYVNYDDAVLELNDLWRNYVSPTGIINPATIGD